MVLLDKKTCCCITGYHSTELPQGENPSSPAHSAMIKRLEQAILDLLQRGVYQFYIGMDCGIELWSAEILVSLKSTHPHLKIYPIISSEEMTYSWSDGWHELYFDVVMPDCEVEQRMSNTHTEDCISHRNQKLSKLCNLFLVLGGDESSASEVLSLAKGKEIIILDVEKVHQF